VGREIPERRVQLVIAGNAGTGAGGGGGGGFNRSSGSCWRAAGNGGAGGGGAAGGTFQGGAPGCNPTPPCTPLLNTQGNGNAGTAGATGNAGSFRIQPEIQETQVASSTALGQTFLPVDLAGGNWRSSRRMPEMAGQAGQSVPEEWAHLLEPHAMDTLDWFVRPRETHRVTLKHLMPQEVMEEVLVGLDGFLLQFLTPQETWFAQEAVPSGVLAEVAAGVALEKQMMGPPVAIKLAAQKLHGMQLDRMQVDVLPHELLVALQEEVLEALWNFADLHHV
jgi:hypothetical protein